MNVDVHQLPGCIPCTCEGLQQVISRQVKKDLLVRSSVKIKLRSLFYWRPSSSQHQKVRTDSWASNSWRANEALVIGKRNWDFHRDLMLCASTKIMYRKEKLMTSISCLFLKCRVSTPSKLRCHSLSLARLLHRQKTRTSWRKPSKWHCSGSISKCPVLCKKCDPTKAFHLLKVLQPWMKKRMEKAKKKVPLCLDFMRCRWLYVQTLEQGFPQGHFHAD